MSYSATVTLTSGTSNANVNNFTIEVYDSSGLRATLATGVTRTDLTAGYTVSGILSTDTVIRVTSNALCVNYEEYFLPAATPTPTPSPVVGICYTVASGVYPTNGVGTTVSGTITVQGASINVWAKHTNGGGGSTGTSNFSGTFNSVNVSGTYTVMVNGQVGYSNSGGTNSNGYVTLAPGTYNFSLTKSDNLSNGATVGMSWSTGTIPASSTYVNTIC